MTVVMSPDGMDNTAIVSDLLLESEAATYLRRPEGTLRNWRYDGVGPAYIREGRHIRYRVSDLEAYLEAGRVDPGTTGARAS